MNERINEAIKKSGLKKKWIAEQLDIPMGRWGEPLDVARAICALLDGSLGYTTGQSIAVDGGMHIRRL